MRHKRIVALSLLMTMLLSACNMKMRKRPADWQSGEASALIGSASAATNAVEESPSETTQQPARKEKTVVQAFPAGNPDDATCKGSYTGKVEPSAVVATVGEVSLTAGMLQAYYWGEVGRFRESGAENGPDFDLPLDGQSCGVDDEVNSWQQYFLKQALNAWHNAEALNQVSLADPLHRDEKYNPNYKNHDIYMEGMPVLPIVYGYYTAYSPNSMHQKYLDQLPETLEDLAKAHGYGSADVMAAEAFGTDLKSLLAFAEGFNRGYMYETYLSYYLEPTQAEADQYFDANRADFEKAGYEKNNDVYVNIRHILLPAGEEGEKTAAVVDKEWQSALKRREQDFAEQANWHSEDSGTSNDGGAYYRLLPGQMEPELDEWCFGAERKPGDHSVISLPDGVHLLYFCGSTPVWQAAAMDALTVHMEQKLIAQAKERFPIQVQYSKIVLGQGKGDVSMLELLYPDIAHERIPEVPVYLQQDYIGTSYGEYPVHTHGCGITTMAMLASYMADDELTVPMMCSQFGNRYSVPGGTDGMLFINEPKGMGFYMIERIFDNDRAHKALEEGHIVVCLQQKGYWTSGGHYLLLEKLNEDGTVQVRDSNTYNYGRIPSHKEDKHLWKDIIGAVSGYWVFDYKVTRIPLCQRCGDPEQTQGGLVEDYLCHKCRTALLRREAYVSMR